MFGMSKLRLVLIAFPSILVVMLLGTYSISSVFRTYVSDIQKYYFGRQVSDVVLDDGYVEFTVTLNAPSGLDHAYFWVEDGGAWNKKCPAILEEKGKRRYSHHTYRVRSKCYIRNKENFRVRVAWLRFNGDTMSNWAFENPAAEMRTFETFATQNQ